jgi:hypothetical protein
MSLNGDEAGTVVNVAKVVGELNGRHAFLFFLVICGQY